MDRPNTIKAIQELGGQVPTAKRMEVSRMAVCYWLKHGLPEPRCYQLAAITTVPLPLLLDERRRKKRA